MQRNHFSGVMNQLYYCVRLWSLREEHRYNALMTSVNIGSNANF